MDKKNIWIINQYAITPDMPGGTRHYNFAKELVNRGYSAVIFASSFHHGLYKELKLDGTQKYKIEKIDGVEFIWIKTNHYEKNDWRRVLNMVIFGWRSYWLARDLIKRGIIQKPDVIIGSSVHLLAVAAAYYLSLCYKAKFIMEVRDLWPKTLIDIGKFRKNNPIVKMLEILEKYLYVRAKKIIVLFPFAKDYIVPMGIPEDKIVWISNGVSVSITEKEIRKTELDKLLKIVYIGSHGIANNLMPIIEAANLLQKKNFKNIKFIFVGNGPEKNKLIKRSHELGLVNIEFRNPVQKKMVKNILNEANAMIINLQNISLMKYGISLNKLYDCMASSRPVILGGDPINNLVKESGCGMAVETGEAEDLANAIIQLYRMAPREREKMGERGRNYVQKHYSNSVLVDKLEKTINEVLNEK